MLSNLDFSAEEMGAVGVLLAAMGGALGLLFRSLMTALVSERDSWKGMAMDAIAKYERGLASGKIKSTRQKVPALAAVVGEHNSPLTKRQRRAAEIATWRARLTAADFQAGEPPRE